MKTRFLITLTAISSCLAATAMPASAQYITDREISNRLDRIERELNNTRNAGNASTSAPINSGSAAALQVDITNLQEEIRDLRGKVEENQFQMKRMSDDFERFKKDTEFRFNELNSANRTTDSSTSSDEANSSAREEEGPLDTRPSTSSSSDEETTSGDGVLKTPDEKDFASPREHYNRAFRLLNQTRYDESAKLFRNFAEKHPDDPLIGNAYYWLGETHYIRSDYVKAADSFRQGFEVLPNGPKAADNLLKLAMSLSAMKKTKESCIVLGQLLLKFSDSSTAVAEKATQERSRLGCS